MRDLQFRKLSIKWPINTLGVKGFTFTCLDKLLSKEKSFIYMTLDNRWLGARVDNNTNLLLLFFILVLAPFRALRPLLTVCIISVSSSLSPSSALLAMPWNPLVIKILCPMSSCPPPVSPTETLPMWSKEKALPFTILWKSTWDMVSHGTMCFRSR